MAFDFSKYLGTGKLGASKEDKRPVPLFPYTITTEPHTIDSAYRIVNPSSRLQRLLEEMGNEAYNPNKRTPERMKNAIAEFPNLPQFYNYLAMAYLNLNKESKANEINKKTIEKFPDYLYARVAVADEALKEEDYDQVRKYLGESLRLEDLYPERKVFHKTEVCNYYAVAGYYHADLFEFERAEEALAILRHVDKDNEQIEILEYGIMAKKMLRGQQTIEEMFKGEITLEHQEFHYENQTEDPPAFHHAEMEWLYQYDFRIPLEKVRAILALPRPTLIEDLETVLQDAINRFDHWGWLGWDSKTHNFVSHAILLLGELRATDSLPAILHQLRLGNEYNEYWFNDWADDIFQTPLYYLGRENPTAIQDFVKEPYIEALYKGLASKTIKLVALQEPERRTEMVEWYQQVLRYFLDHKEDETLLDTTFLAFLIGDAADAGLVEVKSLAKEVYDLGLATVGIEGEWQEVEKKFDAPTDAKALHWKFDDVFKQYTALGKFSEEVEKREKDSAEKFEKEQRLLAFEKASKKSIQPDEPIHVEKIGRNERVSVKYQDGTIKKDVKFKTVEADIESGKATFIK